MAKHFVLNATENIQKSEFMATVEELVGKVEGKEVESNLFTFRIYDCEQNVVNDAIAISRLHFNNKVSDFLKYSVAVWKGKNSEAEEMMGVIMLELQKLNTKDEPVEKAIKTFGEQNG